jgi:IS5 family transposase
MEKAQIREEGVGRAAQDATFINADPGASDSSSPRSTAETRRSRDGSWTKMKKGSRSYFGYKIHVKADLEYGLIRAIRATTASVHDSQVVFSKRPSTGTVYLRTY